MNTVTYTVTDDMCTISGNQTGGEPITLKGAIQKSSKFKNVTLEGLMFDKNVFSTKIALDWENLIIYKPKNNLSSAFKIGMLILECAKRLRYVYLGLSNMDKTKLYAIRPINFRNKIENHYSLTTFELEFIEPLEYDVDSMMEELLKPYIDRNKKGYAKCKNAAMYSCFFLRPILGKDLTKFIGKLVWSSKGTKIWC